MRLLINRHLKSISKATVKIEKRLSNRNSLAMAQINATMLAILIALGATVTIYYNDRLREKKKPVFYDASRVNELHFPISFVRPSSSFPFPKDAEDSVELANAMLKLVDCVGYKSPNEVIICDDVVARASTIYSIMNVVSHRNPFPFYPVEKGNIFNQTSYVQFENIEDIRRWNKNLQRVARALRLPIDMLINRPQIGDKFLSSLPYLRVYEKYFGRIDLHAVERDFKSDLQRVFEISNLVEHSLRDYDRLKKKLPNIQLIVLFFLFWIIVLFLGVVYPIFKERSKASIYVWVPITFYVAVFIFIILMINEKPKNLASFNIKKVYFHVKQKIFKSEQASFMGLGDLPGGDFGSSARGISADGSVVVGNSLSLAGGEAFRWTADTGMVGLGDLSGGIFKSVARASSADGSIIVGMGTSSLSTPNEEAFRWTEISGMIGLGDLPGDPFRSEAFSISADGIKIVGRTWITGSDQRAFLWTEADGMVDLGTFPGESVSEAYGISADGSVIVGWGASIGTSLEAFRWTESTGMVGLGRFNSGADSLVISDSFAYNISADGSTIVGTAGVCGKAFRWKKETGMVAISGCGGRANAASYDGSIVVGQARSLGEKEAIIWDETNGTRKLEEVLTNEFGIDLMDFELKEACDISDDGTVIVGWGTNLQGLEEAWIVKILRQP